MKKTVFAGWVFCWMVATVAAQTPRQVVVEHFTNSRCSVCAANNPQFYSNLFTNYPQVLHIAYHPSSPYSQCRFSLENPTENDARTKYYGVYGATPRAAVQGQVLNNSNPLVPNSAYDNTLGQTSPFAISVAMQYIGSDSVQVTTVVKTTDSHSYTALHLYEAVTEDTIFYNAPNGENLHYNVFHTQLYAGNGLTITPSQTVGDSGTYTASFKLDSAWDWHRINVTALLQDTTSKEILQAARQKTIQSLPTGINSLATEAQLGLFPNPASDQVFFSDAQPKNVWVYSLTGQLLQTAQVRQTLDVMGLQNGAYILKIETSSHALLAKRLVVIH